MPKRKKKINKKASKTHRHRKRNASEKSSGEAFDAEVRAYLEQIIAKYERENHVKTENQAKKQPVQMAPAPSGR